VQAEAGDGRFVTTGFPPLEAKDFRSLLEWLDELDLRESFPDVHLLERAVARGGIDIAKESGDPEVLAIFAAGGAVLVHIAENVPGFEFFEGAQRRDLQCGVMFSPEEAFENPHFVARGFQVEVRHDELSRQVRYPGAPFTMRASPWAITRRPPLVGEHTGELLDRGQQ
jgi:hypothetical protein